MTEQEKIALQEQIENLETQNFRITQELENVHALRHSERDELIDVIASLNAELFNERKNLQRQEKQTALLALN